MVPGNVHTCHIYHHPRRIPAPCCDSVLVKTNVMNLQGQDWGEVIIRKKKPTAAVAQSEQSVNAVSEECTKVIPRSIGSMMQCLHCRPDDKAHK